MFKNNYLKIREKIKENPRVSPIWIRGAGWLAGFGVCLIVGLLLGRAVVNMMDVELDAAWGWLNALDVFMVVFVLIDFAILWRVTSLKSLKNKKSIFWILYGLLILNTFWSLENNIFGRNEIYNFDINLNYLALVVGFVLLCVYDKHLLYFMDEIKIIVKNNRKREDIKKRRYYLGVSFIILLNIVIYSYLLISCSGSFIDEYNHIYSGISFFENGHFAEFYKGEFYNRGSLMSIYVGALLFVQRSIFVAKLAPITVGFLNLFLLIYLSKIYLGEKYSILFLTLYSITPWIIFEHFYIRFYVIVELFVLLSFFLFFKIYKSIELKNKILYFYIFLLLLINGIFSVSQHDISKYILPYMGVIFGALIFLNFFKRFKKIIIKRNIIITFVLASIVYLTKEYRDIISIFTVEPTIGRYDINDIFFDKYLIFIILSLLSLLFAILLRDRIKIIFFVVFLAVFLPLVILFDKFQTLRGSIFLIPLILLFSVYTIKCIFNIYKNNVLKISLLTIIFLILINSFPNNFFNSPHITAEISYKDYYRIHEHLQNKINNQVIISLVPHISEFYGIKVDYVLANEINALGKKGSYHDYSDQTERYTITKTEIITSHDEFLDIILKNKTKGIIIISDSNLYNKYITNESREVIKNIFVKDENITFDKNVGLYIFEAHNNIRE